MKESHLKHDVEYNAVTVLKFSSISTVLLSFGTDMRRQLQQLADGRSIVFMVTIYM